MSKIINFKLDGDCFPVVFSIMKDMKAPAGAVIYPVWKSEESNLHFVDDPTATAKLQKDMIVHHYEVYHAYIEGSYTTQNVPLWLYFRLYFQLKNPVDKWVGFLIQAAEMK